MWGLYKMVCVQCNPRLLRNQENSAYIRLNTVDEVVSYRG
jgi:hypothetical protein